MATRPVTTYGSILVARQRSGMTSRNSFTPAEWRALAQTPVEVMFGVVVASNGGLRRELKTIRRTLRHTDEFGPESELVTHVAGFVRVNADRVRRDAETRDFTRPVVIARAHDHCREATAIVRARATRRSETSTDGSFAGAPNGSRTPGSKAGYSDWAAGGSARPSGRSSTPSGRRSPLPIRRARQAGELSYQSTHII